MKKNIIIIIIIVVFGLGAWALVFGVSWYNVVSAKSNNNAAIDKVINDHQIKELAADNKVALFGESGVVRVLLIGLDKRAGQVGGNCDAIQLIAIDKIKENVIITAVPRGTYSPLPPGKGVTSSDYYVSNACRLGGLDYGIKQIEKILGQKSDYLVVVGFSETLGILRKLKLPTVDTLRWLRQRHEYAIGEPQRAHDHSTFLKYLLTSFVPKENSVVDKALEYIIYKTVNTDLSFAGTQVLVKTLAIMDLTNHPERIQLAMRPDYNVQDIQYLPENVSEYLDTTLAPLKNILSKSDLSDDSVTSTQAKLLEIIENKKNDPEFVVWAFENSFWSQIEDREKRLTVQFDFLTKYLLSVSEKEKREDVISDYIFEMEYLGEGEWAKQGRELLREKIN